MKTIFTFCLSFICLFAISQEIKIASWNIREVFNEDSIVKYKQNYNEFIATNSPDILFVQEFTDGILLKKLKKIVGYDKYDYASSKFYKELEGEYRSFEVGIISKYPIKKVIEYDRDKSPDGTYNGAIEKRIPLPIKNINGKSTGERGLLWVELENNLILIAVHLKSSLGADGKRDVKNAKKRENIVAAALELISDHEKTISGYTYILAGDFNIGVTDYKKNGNDIYDDDCLNYENCNGKDLYDDTYSILTSGQLNGSKMRNLSLSIKEQTYVDESGNYKHAGPIDVFMVYGSLIENFSDAIKAKNHYHSDHYPILTTLKIEN